MMTTQNFKEKLMSKKRWAILLILISIPLSYYGFSNFEAGSSDPLQAIMISLSCTGGIGCFFGGLYLFFIKEKGRGEDLLASQTSEDSPILDKIINKPSKKVNEMAKAKEFELADAVEEFRSLGEDIKKANLVVKTATEKRAVLRDNIAKNKFSIDEDGKIDTMKR
jgi:hypothetical protein